MTENRRLAAILAADVVGYSKMMGEDEAGTLSRVRSLRSEIIEPKIAEHHGRLFKAMGDGFLAEFPSVVNAVACAVGVQKAMALRNSGLPQDRRVDLRIGVHLGDVISEGGDVFGDGVNLAARIEGLAPAGGVAVSAMVHDNIGSRLDLAFEDMGEKSLKNIERSVRVYVLRMGTESPPPRAMSPTPDKPSIAVLPFNNMSGESDQEYFSDGITEDIITELSRFHEFAVIARNSSFSYKGRSPKVEDVGRELGVKYVVEGSVRKIGNRVRITAQLIDSTTASHIWAERYDRSIDDIFAIQDEVTEAVVARIADGVKGARVLHARTRPPHSATAYDLVLQARPYRTSHTASASEVAAKLLRQAIDLDPGFGLAHASLAYVRAGQYEEGWVDDPEAVLSEALSEAKQAVALDGSDGYAHASLAYVLLKYREFDRAQNEVDIALKLNPNHVNIIMTAGWVSVVNCNPQQAIELIKRAFRLNPLMGNWQLWTLGQAYLDARLHREALESFAKVMDAPTDLFMESAVCHAHLGELDSAHTKLRTYLERAEKELKLFPGDDPVAWRAFLLRYWTRRRMEFTDHFIEGARKAGLHVA
jgi:adenylate cyclase